MDTEGLKSLLWLVVFGGLFFVMMRYGCGAHIGGHRHGGHQSREGSSDGGAMKDPGSRPSFPGRPFRCSVFSDQ